MRKIRDNVLKVLVLIALSCTAVFADGEMGGGGLADTGAGTRTGKTVITRTTEDGEMGGGGLADSTYLESVMKSIYDYFGWTM